MARLVRRPLVWKIWVRVAKVRRTWPDVVHVNSGVHLTGRRSPDNSDAVWLRARLRVLDDRGRVQRVSSPKLEVRHIGPGGAKQIRSSSIWERKTAVAFSKNSSAQITLQLTRLSASTPLPLCKVKGFPTLELHSTIIIWLNGLIGSWRSVKTTSLQMFQSHRCQVWTISSVWCFSIIIWEVTSKTVFSYWFPRNFVQTSTTYFRRNFCLTSVKLRKS